MAKLVFVVKLVVKGNLAARTFWRRIPLMQNFFEIFQNIFNKSLADTKSMKTGLKEVTQKL